MLSERLTELAAAGLLTREVEDGPPVNVHYRLTQRGEALRPALAELERWGHEQLLETGTGTGTAGDGGALVVAVAVEGDSSRSRRGASYDAWSMAYSLAPSAPQTGLRGMVNAADNLAATAGIGLLQQGGSAADAAVGAAAVMAVTSPHMCGLGGDLLAMICPPGGEPVALSAIGRAGSGVDADQLRAEGHRVMPLRGDLRTVPVPGAVDGWLALHGRWGRLPLAAVFAPAIELAEEGFVASVMLMLASHLIHDVAGAQELCPHGPLAPRRARAPAVGGAHPACHRPGRARGLLPGGIRPGTDRRGPRDLYVRRSRTQSGPVGRAAQTAGVGPRPVDHASPISGLSDPGQRVDRRAAWHRHGPVGSAVGAPRDRGISRRRARPPDRSL